MAEFRERPYSQFNFRVEIENGPAAAGAGSGVGSGRGLLGIAERAADLGGTAHWGPTPSGGWRLVVGLPSARAA